MNTSKLLSQWNFRKLRNKASNKRRKELVSFHEAGHALMIEHFNFPYSSEIHKENNQWVGSCVFDDANISEDASADYKKIIGIGGLLGEYSYLIICQGNQDHNEQISKDNNVFFKAFEYFIKNKHNNYVGDLTFVSDPVDMFKSWTKAIEYSKDKTDRLLTIAKNIFDKHYYKQ